jgi:hypothetical protein
MPPCNQNTVILAFLQATIINNVCKTAGIGVFSEI